MPEFGQNFRTQILVGLKAEGVGAADVLRDELKRLQRQLAQLYTDLGTGNKLWWDFREAFGPLNRELGDATRRLREVQAAEAAQVAEQAALISSTGAWGAVLRQSGANMATYARQIEEESGKATQKQIADADKAAAAVRKSSDEINSALAREAAAAAEAAGAAEAAAIREADAFAKAAVEHEEFLGRSEAAEEREAAAQVAASEKATTAVRKASDDINAALAREEAASDRATLKQVSDAEKLVAAVRKASDEVNAALAKDPSLAGFAKMNEAIRHIQEMERNWAGSHTRAYAGINREQEHLNDLLAEGLQYENSTVTFVDRAAMAYKAKAFEVEKAADGITHYTAVTDASARASLGGASAMDLGTKSSRNFGLGILNISHAIQDAQYGFGAVVNNIALVTQSLGGGPGLAGTAMVVGVAVSVLANNIKGLAQSVGALEDPTARAAVTLADLKEKIKEVEEKPHKIEVDYQAIEAARKEVEVLERKLSAFKSLEGRTTTQEKVGKAVAETIKEYAGGVDEVSGKENLEKLMIAAAGPQFQEEAIRTSKSKKAEQIREAQSRLEALRAMKPADLLEAEAIGNQINATVESIARLKHDLTDIVKEKVESVIGGAILGIDADRARIAELFDRNEKLFTEGDKARGILPVGPMFRGAMEVASAANVKDRKRFEEQTRRDADMAKEQLKQQKEREALEDQQTNQENQAEEALIARHAAAFGAKKALGGLIEAEMKKLVARGEKDPERLRAAAKAIAEADIRESKFVPEALVPAVAAKVATPHTETAVAELIAGAAPGQDIVAAAKAGVAAGEARAEKPEITREAARMGREIGPDVHDAILRRAARKESDEKISGGLAGQVGKAVFEGGVDPEIVADVAARIIAEQLGRVRAEQVAKGGVKPQTARVILGERQAKAVGQQRGRERQQQGVVVEQLAGQIFQESAPMTGVQFTPEQARTAAQQAVTMTNRGANATQATIGAMQNVLNAMQQLGRRLDGLEMQAHAAGARAQQVGHQQAKQRWQQPPPWNTIGGG
jgi:hypothetical protein